VSTSSSSERAAILRIMLPRCTAMRTSAQPEMKMIGISGQSARRSWVERAYPNLIHYNKLQKGGLRGLGTAEAIGRRAARGLQVAPVTQS
jgi:hypothetical protein